jgi:hypothetical protein
MRKITLPRHLGKVLVAGAVVGGIGVATGVGFAAWTASGNGTGQSKAIARQALTVEASVASEQLYPGATADVVMTVKNPNPYPISLSSIYSNGTIVPGNAGCTAENDGVSFAAAWAAPTKKALTGIVLAGKSSYELTIKDGIAMSNDSVDACSASTFTVPVAIDAASAAGSSVSSPASGAVSL